jgi:hypothetical protein
MAVAARLYCFLALISMCLAISGPLRSGKGRTWQSAPWCIDLPGGNARNGARLQIWDCNGSANQIWNPVLVDPKGVWGPFVIQYAAEPSKCIDIAGGNLKDGATLQLWDCNGLAQQQFDNRGTERNMPLFQIASHANYDLVIDIPSGKMENGNELQMWHDTGSLTWPTLTQTWLFGSPPVYECPPARQCGSDLNNATMQHVIV